MTIILFFENKKSFLDHLREICSFPNESTMVKYMDQQRWLVLKDVSMTGSHEVKDFVMFKDDGTFEAKPMMCHLRMFNRFLLCYILYDSRALFSLGEMMWPSLSLDSRIVADNLITTRIWRRD
jgi:hypothetical protein